MEWDTFEEFYKDIGDIPFKKAQIDRIDSNRNYSKENCRWVTHKENMNNKRAGEGSGFCRFITHKGKTQNLADWAKEYGISREGMRQRYNKYGTVERRLAK